MHTQLRYETPDLLMVLNIQTKNTTTHARMEPQTLKVREIATDALIELDNDLTDVQETTIPGTIPDATGHSTPAI